MNYPKPYSVYLRGTIHLSDKGYKRDLAAKGTWQAEGTDELHAWSYS